MSGFVACNTKRCDIKNQNRGTVKECGPQKDQGEKDVKSKSGGQEMAVMLG